MASADGAFVKFLLLARSRDSEAIRRDAAHSPPAKTARICSRKRLVPAGHAPIAGIDVRSMSPCTSSSCGMEVAEGIRCAPRVLRIRS
jgi:hypothetical protein